MKISIPKLSLVVLIGPSGSGKSTFARKHSCPPRCCRRTPAGAWSATTRTTRPSRTKPLTLLHYIAAKRLALGRLTVIDATNVQPEARKPLVELARKYHCLPVAIVLEPARTALPGAQPGSGRARTSAPTSFASSIRNFAGRSVASEREGFRHVFVLETPEEVEAATVERVPLWNDKRQEHGPFDIIGDVHGCCDELEELLQQLGYETARSLDDPIARLGQPVLTSIPMVARRSSSAIWWTVALGFWTRCGSCATWFVPARPCACPATTT